MSDSRIHEAAATNDVHRVVALLHAGADPDQLDAAGNAPIHLAAKAGAFEAARALIDKGAEVDAPDGKGRTALLVAVDSDEGTGPLIELLRFAGANPHAKAFDGRTPFAAARASGGNVARYFATIRELPALPEIVDEPEATDAQPRRRGPGRRGLRRPK